MNKIAGDTCLSDSLSALLKAKFKENRLPFLTSLFAGLLTYMYCFTNKFETMDDLACFFGTGSSLVLGRWGLKLSELFFPMCSVPWLNGIISLLFLCMAVCTIVRMFSLKDPVIVVLLSALMVSFPAQVCTFGYMYTAPQYAFTLFLATLSARIVSECRNRKEFIVAVAILTLSVGIYQAYVAEAASLLVVYCLLCVLRGENGKTILRKGLLYIAMLAASMAFYMLINFTVNKMFAVEMSEYATESLSGIDQYLFGIRVAYTAFLGYFTKGYYDLIPTKTSLAFHVVAAIVVFVLLIRHFSKKENRTEGKLGVFLLCLALFPLAVDCIRVISTLFHNLMLFSFTSVYVLTAVAFENCSPDLSKKGRGCVKDILAACMIVVAVINLYYANAVFMKLFMQFEQAHSFYTSIVTELRQDPDFNEDSVVCVVGDNDIFDNAGIDLNNLAGMREGIVGTYSQSEFVRFYLGLTLEVAGWDITDVLAEREEVIQMPPYPYFGSVQKLDGYYVIRLG